MSKLSPVRSRSFCAGVFLSCFTASVQAIKLPPPAPPGPDALLSEEIARTALDTCINEQAFVAVAVVDSRGRPRVLLVADSMRGNPLTAVRKANTALRYELPGLVMEEREKMDTVFAAEIEANKDTMNAHGGSMPLYQDGKLIGGIGISGGPHDVVQQCADKAVALYKAKNKG